MTIMTPKPKPMTKRALTALKESIRHWEEMARTGWEKEQPDAEHCALCRVFNWPPSLKALCDGCPVSHSTGRILCVGTPFSEAHRNYRNEDKRGFKKHARAEVAFLKSLLPKGATGCTPDASKRAISNPERKEGHS